MAEKVIEPRRSQNKRVLSECVRVCACVPKWNKWRAEGALPISLKKQQHSKGTASTAGSVDPEAVRNALRDRHEGVRVWPASLHYIIFTKSQAYYQQPGSSLFALPVHPPLPLVSALDRPVTAGREPACLQST